MKEEKRGKEKEKGREEGKPLCRLWGAGSANSYSTTPCRTVWDIYRCVDRQMDIDMCVCVCVCVCVYIYINIYIYIYNSRIHSI